MDIVEINFDADVYLGVGVDFCSQGFIFCILFSKTLDISFVGFLSFESLRLSLVYVRLSQVRLG
jgi:hypothetical protein